MSLSSKRKDVVLLEAEVIKLILALESHPVNANVLPDLYKTLEVSLNLLQETIDNILRNIQ
jgi:hypothetical protein